MFRNFKWKNHISRGKRKKNRDSWGYFLQVLNLIEAGDILLYEETAPGIIYTSEYLHFRFWNWKEWKPLNMPFASRENLQIVAHRIHNLAISDALWERTLYTEREQRQRRERKNTEKKIGNKRMHLRKLGGGVNFQENGILWKVRRLTRGRLEFGYRKVQRVVLFSHLFSLDG